MYYALQKGRQPTLLYCIIDPLQQGWIPTCIIILYYICIRERMPNLHYYTILFMEYRQDAHLYLHVLYYIIYALPKGCLPTYIILYYICITERMPTNVHYTVLYMHYRKDVYLHTLYCIIYALQKGCLPTYIILIICALQKRCLPTYIILYYMCIRERMPT